MKHAFLVLVSSILFVSAAVVPAVAQTPSNMRSGSVDMIWEAWTGIDIYQMSLGLTAFSDDGCTLYGQDVIVHPEAPLGIGVVMSGWHVQEGSASAAIVTPYTKDKVGCRARSNFSLTILDALAGGEAAEGKGGAPNVTTTEDGPLVEGKMECFTARGSATFEHWYLWKPVGFVVKTVRRTITGWLCADGTYGEVSP